VDAFPADTFSGRVKEIRLRSSVSANVVSYITIIEAPNPDLKLKPGMTASITVYTKELNNILLVPAQAKTFQPDSVLAKKFIIDKSPVQKKAATDSGGRAGKTDFVWLKKDNRLIRHPVLTGLDDETQIQILAGLKPSDEIVVGYQEVKKAGKTTAKSPFMPSRPGRSTPRGNAGPPH
jgi:HlyD family secretion protein